MLRTPAPYRLLSAALGVVGMFSAIAAFMPDFADRTRLAEALIQATLTRIDPMLDHASTGRWPAPGLIATASPSAKDHSDLSQHVTTDGILLIQSRHADRVALALDRTVSPGGTIYWRCRVRAIEGEGVVAPLSVPAICRA